MSGPSLSPHAVTIEEMLDKFALEQLVITYCHGIDRQDLKLVRSLYWDDAIDDHGPMFYGNPDEYVAWLPSMLKNWDATAHVIHNTLYLVDGDKAEGEVWMTAYHRTADLKREIIAHGRYIDQYQKRDGIWKFHRRSLALDWMDDHEIPPRPEGGIDDGVNLGRSSADDPAYKRLPLFARQRQS